MNRPTPIAIAVVQHAGCFLIGRRPDSTELGGLWEFPGGKILVDESPEQAAVRECLEETALDVVVQDEYETQLQVYAHGVVHLHFFDCMPSDPQQQPLVPFRWVKREELSQYEFPEGNRLLLARLSASS